MRSDLNAITCLDFYDNPFLFIENIYIGIVAPLHYIIIIVI